MLVARSPEGGRHAGRGLRRLGVTVTPFRAQDDFARALVLQADGKILLAGQFANLAAGAASNFGVMRYTAAGALDPTFGGGRPRPGRLLRRLRSAVTGGRTQLGLVRRMS